MKLAVLYLVLAIINLIAYCLTFEICFLILMCYFLTEMKLEIIQFKIEDLGR